MRPKLRIAFIGLCFILPLLCLAQERTVGAISLEPETSYEGLNLLFPHFQPNVYLVDRCGRVVNQWDDDPDFTPGNIAYIGSGSQLYKAKKPSTLPNETFGGGGAGGIVEVRSWDNDLLWTRTWIDTVYRQHHDLAVMPNGNFLVVVWERFVGDSIIVVGADPTIWASNEIWSEAIYEIDYVNDTIVWEWHAWDHTIQELENTKSNFGVVADHPEKIHLNYLANTTGRPDWLHFNSIDYNPDLDQILISVPHFDEVWIIDHSTTTSEAASDAGGNSGKGGDLIYRWGNPEAYNRGTDDDRQLFFEHDANWIDDDITDGHPYKNLISIFNNRVEDSLSIAIIIDPDYNSGSGLYNADANLNYGPVAPVFSIVHPDSVRMFSSGLSSFQVLDNGNFLICSGRNGYAFEIDENQQLHWEYKTPINRGTIVAQFETIPVNDNITFKVKRYPLDYPGFSALNIPTNPQTIESGNADNFCSFLTPIIEAFGGEELEIFPNPVSHLLSIKTGPLEGETISVINSLGQYIGQFKMGADNTELDVSTFYPGLYILHHSQGGIMGKFIINR